MRALVSLLLLLGLFVVVPRLGAAERVDYLRDVKPLLAARCYGCHAAGQQKGDLRLDTAALLREGGSGGAALVPGKSGESLLIQRLTGTGGVSLMPPKDVGEPLRPEEVARIRAWIDQGAAAPSDEKPEPDPRDHWAFKPPIRPAIPPGHDVGEMSNPIDAFMAARREKEGLTPQGPADRRVLLRRVYLDLLGLPPTRAELEAFEADTSPDAYEKVVEQLLASPRYGERWGRHWMDVWRYSDWWGLGAQVRNSQKHIWHWRDWIIESLNADKGYDQMVREMLAADELYPTDLDRLRGTGFLVRSYFLFNRDTWMEQVVEHTSKAFLGITLNCARCHEHKFDPIEQRDYYRFRAFFEPYQVRHEQIPGETDYEKDALPRAFDCNLDAPTYLFVRGDEKQPRKDRPLKPDVPDILSFGKLQIAPVALPRESHFPGLRPHVLENHLREAEAKIATARQEVEQARAALARQEAAATDSPKKPAATEAVKVLLRDDFQKPHPDDWEMVSGQWKYEDGKLTQRQDGSMTQARLRTRNLPPEDFEARVRFVITGGQMWRSVGLCFDVAEDHDVLVYLSAVKGGSKLQIAYRNGENYVYPPGAMQARAVQINEPQELHVQVRGTLVNVEVNGELALAHQLPVARKPGQLQLLTFDAQATFTRFELATLPASVKLVWAGQPTGTMTVDEARLAVTAAERALTAAEAEPPTLQARAAADRARYAEPSAPATKELAMKAAAAEKHLAVLKAEESLARAEREMARPAAGKAAEVKKKVTAAREALDRAKKAAEAPGEEYTRLRGSRKAPESTVETEAARNNPYPTTSTGRRSALAQWMTDRRHPLTARVAVNHIWARHFGKPLVPTIFDFGRKGTPPTHPELLDWLALELIDSGWSMKHMHRLMVTSSTYRMTSSSAGAVASNLEKDSENRYYWRMNPARMEAQVVRDTLLALSDTLDLKQGGPPIPVNAPSARRSLYFVHSHNDHQKFLSLFDDASVLECYRRDESIVPQQALALTNSAEAIQGATRIAERLSRELGQTSEADFVRAAWEMVLATRPTAEEQRVCEEALTTFLELARRDSHPDPVSRARANLVHALLNHNDFVTVR